MAGKITLPPFGAGPTVPKRSGKAVIDVNDPSLDEYPLGYALIEIGDDPNGAVVMVVNMRPDIEFPAHFHITDQVAIVIEGSFCVGRTWYGPGSIRLQDADSVYGPVKSGPEGCKIIGVFAERADVADHHASESDRLKAEVQKEKYFRSGRAPVATP